MVEVAKEVAKKHLYPLTQTEYEEAKDVFGHWIYMGPTPQHKRRKV
jgi:hypothetical protein